MGYIVWENSLLTTIMTGKRANLRMRCVGKSALKKDFFWCNVRCRVIIVSVSVGECGQTDRMKKFHFVHHWQSTCTTTDKTRSNVVAKRSHLKSECAIPTNVLALETDGGNIIRGTSKLCWCLSKVILGGQLDTYIMYSVWCSYAWRLWAPLIFPFTWLTVDENASRSSFSFILGGPFFALGPEFHTSLRQCDCLFPELCISH